MNQPTKPPPHPPQDLFKASWARAWAGLGAEGDGVAVRDALLARHAEPQRAYHTQQHLAECLSLFDEVQGRGGAGDRPAEVEMALWFHDAVYETAGPAAAENERRSAGLARTTLAAAGVDADALARVEALVMITRHAALPFGRAEEALVDIDLAILGAAEERFAEYEQQIRTEYAHVPEAQFKARRRAVLQAFLEREAIYATPELHRRLEARARANLARSIAALAG